MQINKKLKQLSSTLYGILFQQFIDGFQHIENNVTEVMKKCTPVAEKLLDQVLVTFQVVWRTYTDRPHLEQKILDCFYNIYHRYDVVKIDKTEFFMSIADLDVPSSREVIFGFYRLYQRFYCIVP